METKTDDIVVDRSLVWAIFDAKGFDPGLLWFWLNCVLLEVRKWNMFRDWGQCKDYVYFAVGNNSMMMTMTMWIIIHTLAYEDMKQIVKVAKCESVIPISEDNSRDGLRPTQEESFIFYV